MRFTRYVMDEGGMEPFMTHEPRLRQHLHNRAELGLRHAQANAPRGKSGAYVDGLRVENGPLLPRYSWDLGPRMSVWLHATAPHSAAVEWGHGKGNKPNPVLQNTIPVIKGPHR